MRRTLLTFAFFACLAGLAAPVAAASPPPASPPPSPASGWLIGAIVQGDIAFLTGGDICSRQSQSAATYSCFRADREQYVGVPASGQLAPLTVAYGTTRIALHVERAIVGSLTVGGRVGFALGGGPAPAKGSPFTPLNLEGRVAYWIGGRPSSERGLRGFLALAGGLAQVDAYRSAEIVECRAGSRTGCAPATNEQPGGPNPARQTLDAYKKTGLGFVGLGFGVAYSFLRGSSVVLELRAQYLFPGLGVTLSPSLGYVFHVL